MRTQKAQVVTFDVMTEFIAPLRVLGHLRPDTLGGAPLDTAGPEHLSFCSLSGKKTALVIAASNAGIVLCYDDIPGLEELALSWCILSVKHPRLTFIRCLNNFFVFERQWGIHPTAIIEKDAYVSSKTYIGPMVSPRNSAS